MGGYDSHLIFEEIDKSDVKINVIPNGLKKYMAFFLDKSLAFFDSMQFMNFSLDKLVKNLSDEDFKYLIEEFGSKNLELLKQKGAYPYEYMNSFEKFNEEKLPARKYASIINNWLSKFIINTNNFISKTTRNVVLIFFCVRTFITFNTL